MKLLNITFLLFWSLTTSVFGSEYFQFSSDTAKVFHSIHLASEKFKVYSEKPSADVLSEIQRYNQELKKAGSILESYKSDKNLEIKEIATDISQIITDVIEFNLLFRSEIDKKELNSDELKEVLYKLNSRNQFSFTIISHVTLGIATLLVRERPQGASKQQQFINLTLEERNTLMSQLLEYFGDNIKKGSKLKGPPLQLAAGVLYSFLEMEWNYIDQPVTDPRTSAEVRFSPSSSSDIAVMRRAGE